MVFHVGKCVTNLPETVAICFTSDRAHFE